MQEAEDSYVIPFLTATPNYYGKGVEKCLFSLILQHLKKVGAKHVKMQMHPELASSYTSQVEPLLAEFGFKNLQVSLPKLKASGEQQ